MLGGRDVDGCGAEGRRERGEEGDGERERCEETFGAGGVAVARSEGEQRRVHEGLVAGCGRGGKVPERGVGAEENGGRGTLCAGGLRAERGGVASGA